MATDYRNENQGGINPTYGTKDQLDYAREMAKYLRSKSNKYNMSAAEMVLPYSWMQGIGPNLIDQFAANDYAQIAGQGDLQIRRQAQGLPDLPNSPTTGDSITNIFKKLTSGIKNPFSSEKVTSPGVEPKSDIETGALPPISKEEFPSDATDPTKTQPLLEPKNASNNWEGLTIKNGVDEKAPYMSRNRDESLINRIIIHGDKVTDTNRLLQYGRRVDPQRGFDPNYHYYIARDGTITQGVPDNKIANHAGKDNGDSLGIVLAGVDAGVKPTKEQEIAANRLGAKLSAKYGIDFKNVWGHGEIQPGHRDIREGGDVAKNIRSKGFQVPPFETTTNPIADLIPPEPKPITQRGITEGRMNLGGPTDAPPMPVGGPTPPSDAAIAPMGDKVAQAFGTQPPSNNLPPNANPNPPLLRPKTPEQLDAQVRSVPLDEIGKVIEGHRQELRGEDIKNPFGVTRAIPGQNGQPNQYINMPNQAPMISIGGMSVPAVPDGKGGLKLSIPGIGDRTITSLEDLNKLDAELKNQQEGIKRIGGAQIQPVEDAVIKGNSAPEILRNLGGMRTLVDSTKSIDMGPGSPTIREIKRGLSNYFPGLAKGIAEADTIEKLNGLLASEQTKTFTNRGTNFDLQTFMRTNASLGQSKEGFLMIIDLLEQEAKQARELGNIANKYKGKDPASWNDRKQEYFDDHPLIIHQPMGDGKYRDITTKKITSEKDLEGLPSGMHFITPSGKVGRVP